MPMHAHSASGEARAVMNTTLRGGTLRGAQPLNATMSRPSQSTTQRGPQHTQTQRPAKPDTRTVAARLLRWANEMHYPAHLNGAKMPTADDLEGLCRGNLLEALTFLTERVVSERRGREVRGNLRLHGLEGIATDGAVSLEDRLNAAREKAQLRDTLDRTRAQARQVRDDIAKVSAEIARMRTDITDADAAAEASARRMVVLRSRKAIAGAHALSVSASSRDLSTKAADLSTRAERLSALASEGEGVRMYACEGVGATSSADANARLETAAGRSVRQLCERIVAYVGRQNAARIEGRATGTDADTALEASLWEDARRIVDAYGARALSAGLAACAQSAAEAVSADAAGVDIRRDAMELKFRYESNGALRDASEGAQPLRSVRQLLQDAQQRHVDTFIMTEGIRNTIYRLQAEREGLLDSLRSRTEAAASSADEAVHMRAFQDAAINLAGVEAAVACVNEWLVRARAEMGVRKSQQAAVEGKKRAIAEMEAIAANKQLLIRMLVQRNGDARKDIDRARAEESHVARTALVPRGTQLPSVAKAAVVAAREEFGAFGTFALQLAEFSALQSTPRVAVCALAVHRAHSEHCAASFRDLLAAARFPPYLAMDALIPRIVKTKTTRDAKGSVYREITREADSIAEQAAKWNSSYCEDVTSRIATCDATLIATHESRLVASSNHALDALAKTSEVRASIDAFSTQPGQFAVPWVTVDGENMRQWYDRYSSLVGQMRQLEIASH